MTRLRMCYNMDQYKMQIRTTIANGLPSISDCQWNVMVLYDM